MTPTPEVRPGAEAWSSDGGPHGALVIHGFTGNPSSMRGLAEAFADAGFAVELPRLRGHGTTIDDMQDATWGDWTTEVDDAYAKLAARCDRVVVAGLSMGGTLAIWVTARRPEIAGLIAINAMAQPQSELAPVLEAMIAEGETVMDGVGDDVADPDVHEDAYDQLPLRALLSLVRAGDELGEALSSIACPVLVMTSPNDHVVPPASSDHLAASVSGPVERVSLERSFHVATIDHDKDLINERAVEFARRVTA